MTKWLIGIIIILLIFIGVTCRRVVILQEDKGDFQQLYIQERDSGKAYKDQNDNYRNRVRVLEIESRNKVHIKELEIYKKKFADEFRRNFKNVNSLHTIGIEANIPLRPCPPCPDEWIDLDSNKEYWIDSTNWIENTYFGFEEEKTKEPIVWPCNMIYSDGYLNIKDSLFIAGYEGRRTKKILFIRYGPRERWVDINSGKCFKINYNKYIEFSKK